MADYKSFFLIGAAVLSVTPGCVRVKTDPIRIEPIQIEITINHRLQKELDDVFADLDKASETADYTPLPSQTQSPGN